MAERRDIESPELTAADLAGVQTVPDLAEVLRRLRRREARRYGGTQLTYRELAAKTGWSRGIVGEYFGGKVLPPTDRFDILIRLLGATPAEQGALATVRDRVEEHRRTTAPVTSGPTLRQLPADLYHFTGRAGPLNELDRLLGGGGATTAVVISAVSGTAGVGKTALAVHWAHRVAHRFRDGQLYVNLRGFAPGGSPMTPAEAVRGFLDAFHVPAARIPASLEAQCALYRSLLADRRVLVVLDNARDVEQVRPLLPGSSRCFVVVTSRNELPSLVTVEGAHPVTLDVLTRAEARELVTRRLNPDRVAAEPDAVDEIVTACARLPLALSIAAARAVLRPRLSLARLVQELRETDGLNAFSDGSAASDIRTVFSWSYRSLGTGAARLFRLLGLHPGPDIATPAAASLAGLPRRETSALLAELAGAHLISEHTAGRYLLHDLLRAYAAELAHTRDTETDRRASMLRLLDHYVRSAHAASFLLDPYQIVLTPPATPPPGVIPEELTDMSEAMAWFAVEHPILEATLDKAVEGGFDIHAWQLAFTLWAYLRSQARWEALAAIQAAALETAQRLADRPRQADSHRLVGVTCIRLRRYDDALIHLRRALALYRGLGHLIAQGQTHFDLAWLFDQMGRPHAALSHAQQSYDLFHAAGGLAGEGSALNEIGWFHAQLGNYEKALVYCRRALDTLQEAGDHHAEAATWDSLGYAHRHLAQYDDALACYEHAVKMAVELGDRYNEANRGVSLGDTHEAAGNHAEASAAWRQALRILTDIDHPDADDVRARLRRRTPEINQPE